jgi:hypothetical protein
MARRAAPRRSIEDALSLDTRHGHVAPRVLCWNGADSSTSRAADRAPDLRAGAALTSRSFRQLRADGLATRLDLSPDADICRACLSFVSFALDDGDSAEIARQLRRVTADLWEEGLAELALAAVRRACDHGVPDAPAGLDDLERHAGTSSVARSIVRRLAEELSRRTRRGMHLEALARDRLRLAPPELN